MKNKAPWFNSDLVWGWKVTKGLDPQHFDAGGKLGEHKLTDTVTAPPETAAHHTIVVAQSGSGKSFFLGRVIEEIALKTRCRVLIFDMNSDFKKIDQAQPPEKWKEVYDRETKLGFLAEEPSQQKFLERWGKITKTLYTTRPEPGQKHKPLQLDWLKFPADLLAEDADEEMRNELRHCHNLVNTLAEIAKTSKHESWVSTEQFLKQAEMFCDDTRDMNEEKIIERLSNEFGAAAAWKDRVNLISGLVPDQEAFVYLGEVPSLANLFSKKVPIELYQRAATFRRFVQPNAVHLYFGRAFELKESGLIDPNIGDTFGNDEPSRIEVVDLPSIGNGRHQKMAMSTFLEAEWQRARRNWERALQKTARSDKRVPLFIVVEEAHNALPDDATTATERKLRDQFRQVAAEGRKYGLFLILVSQRPDKLDRMVMSECENRAIMRVGSTFVLRKTCEVLGMDGVMPKMTDKALEFDIGRALLAGPWVLDEPTFLASAARRTMEGGRNLNSDYWARLPA